MGAKVQKILHIRKRACNIFFQYRERDFLRKSLASLVKEKPKNTFRCAFEFSFQYRERDFLRKSLRTTCKSQLVSTLSKLKCSHVVFQYRERDLNPHSHHWPKDFKSFVSTDSTIAARNRLQRYNKKCKYANKSYKKIILSHFLPLCAYKKDCPRAVLYNIAGMSCFLAFSLLPLAFNLNRS